MSHVHLLCSFLVLFVSFVLRCLRYEALQRIRPVLNQVALQGLLPWHSLTLPCFPLLVTNYTLFVTLSLVNTVALTSSKGQLLANGLVLVAEHVLMLVFAAKSPHYNNELTQELGLAGPLQLPVPDALSAAYSAHLFTTLALSFVLCGHVVMRLWEVEATRQEKPGLRES